MSTTSHLVNTTIDRFAALPLLSAALLLVVTGCADIKPYVPPSEGHISKPAAKPGPEKVIPPPARTSTFVPPPKPVVKPQTYSVVVNEVPVKELLLALARDTKQNIDIHPGLTGLVSLNAINETLPAILDRVSKQVNMRYRMEGNTIIVSTDTPYMRTYRINYVNMTRDTTSTIGVTGDIGATAQAGASGGTPAAGSGTSASRTTVTTTVKNDFWDSLRENIRAILASTRARSLSQEERAIAAEERRAAREDALKQAEAVSRAGQAAPALLSAAFRGSAPSTLPDVKDDIIINPVTGTVSVLGTERQHQLVQQHIDSITAAAQRQVLIEATIVEVSLSEAYQGGIDWSRLELGKVGWTVAQSLLGGFNAAAAAAGAAAGNAITVGYQNTNDPGRSINLTIKLLEEFGNTKVLSSPKLMALNNQTALLKVVDNIVYFEIKAETTTSSNSPSLTTFNTIAKTVSVGVVMGVTPQINDDGRVTLSVRPTISRVIRFKNDPNPSLCDTNRTNCIASPVPEVQTREMESVLQVGSGQTVILGGLMQDELKRNREQVPGADKIEQPLLGEALRFRDERAAKSELIIFLRPTVVTNPSLASEELKFFERFLPQPETPPAKAGTTR